MATSSTTRNESSHIQQVSLRLRLVMVILLLLSVALYVSARLTMDRMTADVSKLTVAGQRYVMSQHLPYMTRSLQLSLLGYTPLPSLSALRTDMRVSTNDFSRNHLSTLLCCFVCCTRARC